MREEAASDWCEFFWDCPECGYVNTITDNHCQRLGCEWERE